ncbi:hypothetical protein Bca4012_020802 [Brassica carinata]
MANLFVESEVIVYKEIVGDPIFDVYDDEDQIQNEDNEFDVQASNNEVSLQKIGLFAVEGRNLALNNSRTKDFGGNWGLKKIWPNTSFYTWSQ